MGRNLRGSSGSNNDNPFRNDSNSDDSKRKLGKLSRKPSPGNDSIGNKFPRDNKPILDNKPNVSIKYKGSMSSKGYILLIILLAVTVVSVVLAGFFYTKYRTSKIVYNEQLGEQVVKDLYTWGVVQVKDQKTGKEITQIDVNQIQNNMNNLKTLCTPSVYSTNTAENSSTTLPMYLQFGQHASRPNILKVGPGFVIFSVVSPNIESSRTFEISYTINKEGKIDWMYQAETRAAINYGGSIWK